MPDTLVQFIDVSKRYFIGEHSIRTFREDFNRAFMRVFGGYKEDKKEIWGLKDVNFSINAGDSIGLIGPNGSGKTTIFKLLSRITKVTKGRVIVNGRVGSLIDLHAGFHPELTGLENIYLNAAIRGMKRKEIKLRVEEIVGFAGIERFKDTPLKHYSAGMCVRLGFSVAVFCPFDILIIDEVLAVGDLSFQDKCFEKISELQKKGKAIFFVSQDTDKVKQITKKVIYLSFGKIVMFADAQEAINKYLEDVRGER